MNTSTIIAVVAMLVVLAVAVLALRPLLRRRRLQARFGPEYDRAVQDSDSRAAAERELAAREKQHRQLELRPLDPQAHERYTTQWAAAQARFVDEPEAAVDDADRLVTELMAERGYPTGDYDEQLAVLSVEHSGTLQRYRAAHDIRRGGGSVPTEDLRNALVHYRALFAELLGTQDGAIDATDDRAAGDAMANGARTYDARAHEARADDTRADEARADDTSRGDADLDDAEQRTHRHHPAR